MIKMVRHNTIHTGYHKLQNNKMISRMRNDTIKGTTNNTVPRNTTKPPNTDTLLTTYWPNTDTLLTLGLLRMYVLTVSMRRSMKVSSGVPSTLVIWCHWSMWSEPGKNTCHVSHVTLVTGYFQVTIVTRRKLPRSLCYSFLGVTDLLILAEFFRLNVH